MYEAKTDKILVLGVDGFDPRFAKHCLNKGLMPNFAQFIKMGSAREDLVLLGAHPTVTPPMWTTLATGAYAGTHGITAFYNQHPFELDTRIYALDSRMCRAEQLWNVFAEAGKETLVWHWPGSSWPPSSDNPHLHVVDGTQPGAVNMGTAMIDWEKICVADEKIEQVTFKAHTAAENGAGCIITGLEGEIAKAEGPEDESGNVLKNLLTGAASSASIYLEETDSEIVSLGQVKLDEVASPIQEPRNWLDAPAGAREFAILTSEGLLRRSCLILRNAEGIYDRVAIYKSKKDSEPLAVLHVDDGIVTVWDAVAVKDEVKEAYRSMRIINLAEDGSHVELWLSIAYDAHNDTVWHPKQLMQEIMNNIGPIPQVSVATGKNPEYAQKLLMASWDKYCLWQAQALEYLMGQYEIIFSHLHNCDLIGHQIWHFGNYREDWQNDVAFYQDLMEKTYVQIDEYIGHFLPYLQQDWTMIITSDHGLICEENAPNGLGEGRVNASVMKELGYTVLKKDAQGHEVREIDWTKTRAIASRGEYININLKGRNPHGIVEAADKYELEGQIISDLYNYRDPITGKRMVALALRNKDAVHFGLNGPETGDIIYFMDEGFNIIHMDSLSSFAGHFDTSVSPIFAAAGKGIKAGCVTSRVIRQVDVAPTLAVLGGVRMPRECEGAPVYQIIV